MSKLNDKQKAVLPAQKLELINQLLGGQDECPACGHVTERPAIITPEQALELMNVPDKEQK